jgi:hypothetical protein
MSDEKKTSGSRWQFWPEWAWRWKICDNCQRSRLHRRVRFCADCGRELRISDLPLERIDWLAAWFTLAFYLWLIEAVVFGMAEINQTGGIGLLGMLIPAGAIVAAFALVVVWRQTRKQVVQPTTNHTSK